MLRNVPASHLSAKVVSLLNEILSLNAQEYQVYSRTKVWPIVPQ